MPHLAHPFDPWTGTAMPLAALLAGVVLLLFGRRLFWLFVGVIGFMVGWHLALGGWQQSPAGGRLLLALLCGVVGVVLALFLQKIAVALAGFFLGVSLVGDLLGWHLAALRPGQLLVLVVVGVLAAILALMLFDLALILYSAITGASLILDSLRPHFHFGGDVRLLLLVLLAVVGAAFQARWLQRGRVHRT